MRARSDFGRILDDKLEAAAFAWSSPFKATEATTRDPRPRPVFLFGDLHTGFTAGPARQAAASGASPWTPVYDARPGAQIRPARRLTPQQQAALDALRAMGADSLTPDFTDAEIKSAFRALVRTFHPDRHPGSSDAERALLSRRFAAVCDAYRTLTTAVH